MNGLEERLSNLENRIKGIEERNRKVELDKAWETSITRKIIIGVLTYLTVVIVMMSLALSDSWINAIIPTIGFLISTSSVPIFKRIWIDRQNNSRNITAK